MYKILVADDHAVVRKGLLQILQGAPGLCTVQEAGSGAEVLQKCYGEKWDGVILDLAMPGMSGLDVLKQLKAQHPVLPVLVLSVHPEEQYARRVLKAGAAGYLTKDSAPDELVKAVQKICSGGRYVSASLAEMLAFTFQEDGDRPAHEGLSDREYQVLRLMASGYTISEIAEKLVLSVKTVSTYRTRLLQKMNMSNNAELMHYAFQNGLLEEQ
ncbi:MAG: response regulator transcription factor [Candidatus Hydrogenedentes bacterium]|nr:response regulator transcription factor [Candidatus Hydrogenedentota bacterium]